MVSKLPPPGQHGKPVFHRFEDVSGCAGMGEWMEAYSVRHSFEVIQKFLTLM